MNVAIVMPYYNEPELLIKSVMAILGQSYQYWKLFIIDDGSEKHKKAKKVLGNNLTSRVKIIEKENGGVSLARNTALSLIKKDSFYKYIAFCDADDIWSEHYLSSQLQMLQTSNADLVYSNVNTVFQDGGQAFRIGIPDPVEYPGLEFMLKNPFIFISSVVCKKECLSVGEFNSNLDSIEDWDMWLRIAKAGYKLIKNRYETIQYTVKNSGMASKNNETKRKEFLKLHPDSDPKSGINEKQENELDKIFNECCQIKTDINELLPVLKKYGERSLHITEMGTRDVFSTWGLLASRPKKMISYDLYLSNQIWNAQRVAKDNNIEFVFKNEDVLKADIEQTDLLFIDTLHTYQQLKQELNLHASKVNKYILLHDTLSFGNRGEDGQKGLMFAIYEFLGENSNWIIKEHYKYNNGLMVLEKIT